MESIFAIDASSVSFAQKHPVSLILRNILPTHIFDNFCEKVFWKHATKSNIINTIRKWKFPISCYRKCTSFQFWYVNFGGNMKIVGEKHAVRITSKRLQRGIFVQNPPDISLGQIFVHIVLFNWTRTEFCIGFLYSLKRAIIFISHDSSSLASNNHLICTIFRFICFSSSGRVLPRS